MPKPNQGKKDRFDLTGFISSGNRRIAKLPASPKPCSMRSVSLEVGLLGVRDFSSFSMDSKSFILTRDSELGFPVLLEPSLLIFVVRSGIAKRLY